MLPEVVDDWEEYATHYKDEKLFEIVDYIRVHNYTIDVTAVDHHYEIDVFGDEMRLIREDFEIEEELLPKELFEI